MSVRVPSTPARTTRRVARRSPDVARQEILAAAAFLLHTRPFRDITIGDIMERTKIGRSAFYVYFRDVYTVVECLMANVRDEVLEHAKMWSAADQTPDRALREFLTDTANLWTVNGTMLGAMIDAAAENPNLDRVLRDILDIYQRTVTSILIREHEAGRTAAMDFDEISAALVIGTTAYFKSRLGHAGRRDPLRVAATIKDLWGRAIYAGRGGFDSLESMRMAAAE